MQMLRIACSVLAGAVLTAACGDSNSSLNPTAPSGVSASSLHADAGGEGATSSATAKGGNGNGKGNGNGNNGSNNGGNNGGDNGKGGPPSTPGTGGGPGNTSPGAPGQQKVEIEGLVTSVGTDSLTVNGQTVLVTSDTVIRHGNVQFTLSQLSEGDRVHVRAVRVPASEASLGAAAVQTLQATEIKLQNPDGGDGEEPIGADEPGSDVTRKGS